MGAKDRKYQLFMHAARLRLGYLQYGRLDAVSIVRPRFSVITRHLISSNYESFSILLTYGTRQNGTDIISSSTCDYFPIVLDYCSKLIHAFADVAFDTPVIVTKNRPSRRRFYYFSQDNQCGPNYASEIKRSLCFTWVQNLASRPTFAILVRSKLLVSFSV